MKWFLPLKNSTGAVTIVVAFALAALMATTALIVDIGLLYQERRQLQTAVDAAALAAAQDLAEGRGELLAEARAEQYLGNNAQVPPESFSIAYPAPQQVEVTARTKRTLFLAKIFGKSTASLKASAIAAWGPASAVRNLVPILVPVEYVSSYTGPGKAGSFELGTDRPREESPSSPGKGLPRKAFFWLGDFDAGSGGTPDYADWIINGYPEEVEKGAVANGEGVKAALKEALAQRIEIDKSVILPLYDTTEGGGSPGKYHTVGFAEFVITGFDLTGNPKTISGYFTTGTVTSGAGGEEPSYDFGIRAIWLTD